LNDFAFELCAEFVPGGDRLFKNLSRYDDYLVEVEKRPGHPAGSTLRWVAPFLRAYGVSEEAAREFAARRLLVLPGVPEVLPVLARMLPTFIISASFRPYLEALCQALSFPLDRTFFTPFPLNRYAPKPQERERLVELAQELASLEPLEWPTGASSAEDLEPGHRQAVAVMAEAIREVEAMELGRLMEEIPVMGGWGKARALEDIGRRLSSEPGEALYFGDSITDAEALSLVRQAGGVAVAFNANRYALAAAEVACISPNAGPILILAAAHACGGPEAVRRLAASWPDFEVPADLKEVRSEEWRAAEVTLVANQDFEELVQKAEAFRRKVRGEAIGSLG
jgi:predicted HAD superfamily phosphohydrolase